MRRANSQKVDFVPFNRVGNQWMSGYTNTLSQAHCRARKSVTVIGIALSVTVTATMVPLKNSQANAAASVNLEPFANGAAASPFLASISTGGTLVEQTPPLAGTQTSPTDPVVVTTTPLPSEVSTHELPIKPVLSFKALALEPAPNVLPSPAFSAIAEASVRQGILPTVQPIVVSATPTVISSPSAISSPAAEPPVEPLAASPSPPSPSAATEALVEPVTPLPTPRSTGAESTTAAKNSSNPSVPVSHQLGASAQLKYLNLNKPIAVDKRLAEAVVANVRREAPVSPALAYQVKSGDTLEAIAASYQVSAQALVKTNRLADPDLVLAGQVLKIFSPPGDERNPEAASIPSSNFGPMVGNSPTVTQFSAVPENDSGAGQPAIPLAKRGVTESAQLSPLGALNQTSITHKSKSSGYQVKPGDTLESIAKTYQVSAQELVKANQLTNPNLILAGQNLKLLSPQSRLSYKVASIPNSAPGLVSDSPSKTIVAQSSTDRSSSDAATPVANSSQPQVRTTQIPKDGRGLPAIGTLPQKIPNATPVTPSSYVAIVKRTVLPQLSRLKLPPLAAADTYLPTVSPSSLIGTGHYISPAKGVLTSGYGRRWGRMHRGIDIAAPVGTPVVASAPGVVVASGWNSGGYGNLVEIKHSGGGLTVYAHNSRILAQAGQQVDQGQQIAEMGSTGRSTGPHVHFEVHIPGKGAVNPMFYLARR